MRQRYLLDSHVFLWLDTGDKRLGADHLALLADPENEVFLSVATIWELSIKRAGGRLAYALPFAESARSKGIRVLPILAEHAQAIEDLERHHNDPFDHLLVAQAQVEGLVLVTHDRALMAYNVPMLRV